MQRHAPELEGNSITAEKHVLPKEGHQNEGHVSSASSEDEDPDSVVDPLARLALDPTQARRRSSTGHLNFVDQVSAGIGSYLARLEAKHVENTTVYNRSAGREASRWQDCIRQVPSPLFQSRTRDASKETAAEQSEDGAEDPADADAARIKLKLPQGGRPASGDFGPCVPPKDLEFESFPGSDGRSRLSFSASFESGNLAVAQCDNPTQYTLLVDVDANTEGYTQWFYFAVRGGTAGLKITFRLINMAKSSSLFGEKGMRPVIWSEQSGRGWERGCSDVSYSATESSKAAVTSQKNCFTLSFAYTFEFDDDTVFFAYHYPYTYSYLTEFINTLEAHPYAGKLFSRKPLCHTIGGLPCEALEIDSVDPNVLQRGLAVLTARVHPGESNASWMMHGFILFLLSPAAEAIALRKAFKWLIVPMLNPDGVVRGCYRCSLAGTDLNRVYLKPSKRIHPEIYHLKEAMKQAPAGVEIFVDFHGHSKKEGIFFYGGKAHQEDRETNASIQLLPRLCSLGSSDFIWSKCSFNVYESKISTARLVGFLQLKIQRAYTVEASFATNGRVRREVSQDEEESDDPQMEAEEQKVEVPFASSDQAMVEAAAVCLLQQLVAGEEQLGRRDSNFGGNRVRKVTRTDLATVSKAGDRVLESPMLSPASPSSPVGNRMAARRHSQRKPSLEDGTVPPIIVPQLHLSMGSVLQEERDVLQERPPSRAKPKPDETRASRQADTAEFNPMRLMLAGPTIGRAIRASCDLELPPPDPPCEGLLAGPEAAMWPHLQYHRLTIDAASRELAKLVSGKCNKAKDDDDDDEGGSDSNPSADEKPAAELRKIQKRLACKAKRQKTYRLEPEEVEEEVKYKVIVAFGKSMKIPIKQGEKVDVSSRRNSQVDEAAEKFIRMARRHSERVGDKSPMSVESPTRLDAESPSEKDRPATSLAPPLTDRGRQQSFDLGSRASSRSRASSFMESRATSPASPTSPWSSAGSPSRRRSVRGKSKEVSEPGHPGQRSETEEKLEVNQISFHLPGPTSAEDPDLADLAPSPASPLQSTFPAEGSSIGFSVEPPSLIPRTLSEDEAKGDELSPNNKEADSRQSSRRLSSRHRHDAAELAPIVYSPGCPPPAGSHVGGSCIQLELDVPAGIEGAQAAERRQSTIQAKQQAAEKIPPFSRQVSPATAEAKLAHIILPEIAPQPASPDKTAVADASPHAGIPERAKNSGPSFKEWIELQRGLEVADLAASPTRYSDFKKTGPQARRPASTCVRRHAGKSKPTSDAGPPDHSSRAQDDDANVESAQHQEVPSKPKAPSRVTVHFRTRAPPQSSAVSTVAKIAPGSVALKTRVRQGSPPPEALQLRLASKDSASPRTAEPGSRQPPQVDRPASANPTASRATALLVEARAAGEAKRTLVQLLDLQATRHLGPCSRIADDMSTANTARERHRVQPPKGFSGEAALSASQMSRGCGSLRTGGWARVASE